MLKDNNYNVGDEVYHIGYLCVGVIKEVITKEVTRPHYVIDWKEKPLLGVKIYFGEEYLEVVSLKYYIKKANGGSLYNTIKKYREKMKKQGPERMSIFSSEGGKIIEK